MLMPDARLKVRAGARPSQRWHTKAVPIPLQPGFNREIDEQLRQRLIEPAGDTNDPSEWVHPIVVVAKKMPVPRPDPDVRITVDMTSLNKSLILVAKSTPSPQEKVTRIPRAAAYFTVLDGQKGYHQVPLHKDDRHLTTFLAAHRGRFRYCRLPMGAAVSDAIFTEKWETIIRPHANYCTSVVEDVLIWGESPRECSERTQAVLASMSKHDASVNDKKTQFCKREVLFSGMLISQGQYRIDPNLTKDLREFPAPTNVKELKSFLGLAQQLGTYTDDLTTLTEPLRGLNKKGVLWQWTARHQAAFEEAREALSAEANLAPFNPARKTRLATDASRLNGLGFLLTQRGEDGQWRLVQCGSRRLSKHEANWSGVAEIEGLAAAWACRKCAYFLEGLEEFELQTDNLPLTSILNNKRPDQLNNDRLLKIKTYLSRFNVTAVHVKGASHCAADALSRIPGAQPTEDDQIITETDDNIRQFALAAAVELALPPSTDGPTTTARAYATAVGSGNPPSRYEDARADQLRREADSDPTYQLVIRTMRDGWPDQIEHLPTDLRPFHNQRVNLSEEDGLLLYGSRIVIPAGARDEVLNQIHAAHQGESKSWERARRSVWWPTVAQDVTRTVRNCTPCREYAPSQANLPRLNQETATAPFQRIQIDLCQELGAQWFVAVDEYSGYIDIRRLGKHSTADLIIDAMRETFNAMDTPAVVKTDGGPQLPGVAHSVTKFLEYWGIAHDSSSPCLPETNGMAEAAVKAAKKIIRGAEGDPDRIREGVEAHRNTPRRGGRSPSEMTCGRQRRERLPVHPSATRARGETPLDEHIAREQTALDREHTRYDEHTRDLPPLHPGDTVVVQDKSTKRWRHYGTVVGGPDSRREYSIRMGTGGVWRRNRRLIRPTYTDDDRAPPDTSAAEDDLGPPPLARRNNHSPEELVHQQTPRRSSRGRIPRRAGGEFVRPHDDGRKKLEC